MKLTAYEWRILRLAFDHIIPKIEKAESEIYILNKYKSNASINIRDFVKALDIMERFCSAWSNNSVGFTKEQLKLIVNALSYYERTIIQCELSLEDFGEHFENFDSTLHNLLTKFSTELIQKNTK